MFVRRKARGLKRFLNVTWDEIRQAERYGDKEMEFELYDIFERASIYGGEIDRKIEENIEYTLRREGLLPRGASVTIPAGALLWQCYDDQCYYDADFEVFDETGNKVLARGKATGIFYLIDDETAELQDVTVSMPTDHVKRLKSLAEGLKAMIASVFGLPR